MSEWKSGACAAVAVLGVAAAALGQESGAGQASGAGQETVAGPAAVQPGEAVHPSRWRHATVGEELGGVEAGGMFPERPRPLMPYLQMADRFGMKASKPGALIESDPVSRAADAVKARLAEIGLRYSFEQAFTVATMTEVVKGNPTVGAYLFSAAGNWTVFDSDELSGTSGWMSFKVNGGAGLGADWEEENPKTNIGAFAAPNNDYYRISVAMEEVAWGQSFAGGKVVVFAGMVNQSNYMDINKYANSAHGQFLNAALVNSQVLPMPGNNLGVQAQWQPVEGFYAMFGVGTNNQGLGESPFDDVSGEDMSYVGELGWVMKDVMGLGPGTYRVQPFAATTGGEAGGGVCVNFEQQLGAHSPLGVFARAGWGSEAIGEIPGNAQAQVSGGLAMLAPFAKDGAFSARNNDFLGVGLVWTRTGDLAEFVNRDEYAVEMTAVFQLTPTMTIQPDLQFVWDPAKNPDRGPAMVAQLQLNVAW